MQNFKWRGKSEVFQNFKSGNSKWRGKSDAFPLMDLRGQNFTFTMSDGLHYIETLIKELGINTTNIGPNSTYIHQLTHLMKS